MSKFDFSSFCGVYNAFAVNAEKYSLNQAIAIFERETDGKVGINHGQYKVTHGFVRHRAGIDEDGERRVCWWLEYSNHGSRSCPVFAFCQI